MTLLQYFASSSQQQTHNKKNTTRSNINNNNSLRMLAATANAARRVAQQTARRSFSSSAAALPTLNYDYGALEPAVSAQIMEIHHSKHHATYVANYNAAMETYADAEARGDVATMIALQGAIKFNGGGA